MPHHARILEKIAFALVVLSALVCSAFITYEKCPDARVALQAEKDLLACNVGYSFVCETEKAALMARPAAF
jgi:hypothetical protein